MIGYNPKTGEMSEQIKLIINMRIFPKPRPRQGKHGNWYTPRDHREDNLEGYFWQFCKQNQLGLIEDNISLECKFYVKGLAGMDLDNVLKSILDCGKGILWKNDNQIKRFREVEFIENSETDSIEMIIEEVKL